MNSKITTGHLDIIELPFLNTKRTVRIWTPDGYNPKDKTEIKRQLNDIASGKFRADYKTVRKK